MTMLAAAISLLATTWLYHAWRAYTLRKTRWELYRLRDLLRSAAVHDRELLRQPAFWRLDEALTSHARAVRTVTLWVMVPVLLSPSLRKVAFEGDTAMKADLEAARNPTLDAIQKAASTRLGICVFLGHPLLVIFCLVLLAIAFLTGHSIRSVGDLLLAQPPPAHFERSMIWSR